MHKPYVQDVRVVRRLQKQRLRNRSIWKSTYIHKILGATPLTVPTFHCIFRVRIVGMKLFNLSHIFALFCLVGRAFCFPPVLAPPQSVVEGEEGIQHIWQSAVEGRIANVLPHRYKHLQEAWERFLIDKGPGLVESFYA